MLTGVVEGQEDLARLSKLAEEASGGSQEPGDEVRLRVHTLSQIDAGVADTLSQVAGDLSHEVALTDTGQVTATVSGILPDAALAPRIQSVLNAEEPSLDRIVLDVTTPGEVQARLESVLVAEPRFAQVHLSFAGGKARMEGPIFADEAGALAAAVARALDDLPGEIPLDDDLDRLPPLPGAVVGVLLGPSPLARLAAADGSFLDPARGGGLGRRLRRAPDRAWTLGIGLRRPHSAGSYRGWRRAGSGERRGSRERGRGRGRMNTRIGGGTPPAGDGGGGVGKAGGTQGAGPASAGGSGSAPAPGLVRSFRDKLRGAGRNKAGPAGAGSGPEKSRPREAAPAPHRSPAGPQRQSGRPARDPDRDPARDRASKSGREEAPVHSDGPRAHERAPERATEQAAERAAERKTGPAGNPAGNPARGREPSRGTKETASGEESAPRRKTEQGSHAPSEPGRGERTATPEPGGRTDAGRGAAGRGAGESESREAPRQGPPSAEPEAATGGAEVRQGAGGAKEAKSAERAEEAQISATGRNSETEGPGEPEEPGGADEAARTAAAEAGASGAPAAPPSLSDAPSTAAPPPAASAESRAALLGAIAKVSDRISLVPTGSGEGASAGGGVRIQLQESVLPGTALDVQRGADGGLVLTFLTDAGSSAALLAAHGEALAGFVEAQTGTAVSVRLAESGQPPQTLAGGTGTEAGADAGGGESRGRSEAEAAAEAAAEDSAGTGSDEPPP